MTDDGFQQVADAIRRASEDAPPREDCPSPERVWGAVKLELPLTERVEIIDHTTECLACAEAWRIAMTLGDRAAPAEHGSGRPRWSWMLTGARAAGVLLAVAGLAYFLMRRDEPPVDPQTAQTTPTTQQPPRAEQNTAKGLTSQGDLTGAARAIVGGLKDNPKNSELTGTILQLYRAAEAEATNARNAADAAGAKDRPEYAHANARLQTARNSSRIAGPENAESIVFEFGAAADLYRAAAARVKTDPRALDELAIRKLLADYAEAYNSMDVRRVRRFKPSFTDFPTDLSSTKLTISDIRIVLAHDRQTASVTLAAQYKNTYRRGAVPGAIAPPALRLTWRAQRKGDAWILVE